MNERLAAEVRSLLSEDILEYAFPGLGDGCVLHEELCEDMLRELIAEPFAEPSNDELDPRTIEIISQLQALKERYGLSDGELDRLLGYTVRPSRLRITHSGRLLLEDFDAKEVRMDSLCKAVFFLFLKHPEGIDFKSLGEVSRIKRAFENVVESRIASFYCITGKAGDPKRISLDRTLVVWE